MCVLGGPEFPAGTGARQIKNSAIDQSYDKCFDYLINRPSVDYFAYSDGEVAFLEIVKEFISNNCSLSNLKEKNKPIKGCANISKCKTKLLVGDYIPRIGMEGSVKSYGRDIIPSPYLSGLLDKFLDELSSFKKFSISSNLFIEFDIVPQLVRVPPSHLLLTK